MPLLYAALSATVSPNTNQPTPALIQLDQFVLDVVRRINLLLDRDASLRLNELTTSVRVWSLAALLANLFSAGMLLIVCVYGWRRERTKMRITVVVFAVVGGFTTALTAPLLYSTAFFADGRAILIDAAAASLLIYICCLVTDVMRALDFPAKSTARASFLAFIFAVDLPCIGVTALFSLCAIFISFPAAFVAGTVAALFAYYSVAFLLLASFNWFYTTKGGQKMMSKISGKVLLMIALGAALNGSIGTIVQFFKLPVYLDLAGSFVVAATCGLVPAIISAALGVLILGLTTTPIAIAYIGTAILVSAAAVGLVRFGFMSSWLKTVLFGLFLLGPLSTVLSVPVTVYLFGGVTLTGSDVTTLFFTKMGDGLLEAVIKGAVLFDILDKGLSAILAFLLYKIIPQNLLLDLKT